MSEVIKTGRPLRHAHLSRERESGNPFPDMDSIRIEPPVRRTQGTAGTRLDVDGTAGRSSEATETPRNLDELFQRGFDAGRRDAEEALQEEFEEQLRRECEERTAQYAAQWENILSGIRREWSRVRSETAESIVKISLLAAERIVKQEMKSDPSVILNQVREGLRHVTGVDRIKIRVHPDDEAFLRENRPGVLAGSDSIREMLIEPDAAVQRGGCVLESESGNVDATLETQLKKIEGLLREDRHEAR